MASTSLHLEYLEEMAGVVISGLEIPSGISWVYELDADLEPLPDEFRRGSWQVHPTIWSTWRIWP